MYSHSGLKTCLVGILFYIKDNLCCILFCCCNQRPLVKMRFIWIACSTGAVFCVTNETREKKQRNPLLERWLNLISHANSHTDVVQFCNFNAFPVVASRFSHGTFCISLSTQNTVPHPMCCVEHYHQKFIQIVIVSQYHICKWMQSKTNVKQFRAKKYEQIALFTTGFLVANFFNCFSSLFLFFFFLLFWSCIFFIVYTKINEPN